MNIALPILLLVFGGLTLWVLTESALKWYIKTAIIKEPNKFTKFDGKIYILLESAEETETNSLVKFFGYNRGKIEPRLYGLEYSRGLHEQLEKSVVPSLKRGHPVAGKLNKEGVGKGKRGDAKIDREGDGSESQDQEWHFHKLLPSEIHRKPER